MSLSQGDTDATLERRICAAIIALTPILFMVFLVISPSANPTFDDAKYVAAGRSFLDGHGPTVFGVVFLKHSPLWPMLIVIPERLFGWAPIATGHVINAVSAATSIVLVGLLGWRVRPAIGAISAVLFASLPYVLDVSRTAGIDLPSIALTLGYILLGMVVVRRGSLPLALLLGLIFAAAFDIKETILPFALVPFLLGVLWGVPWATIFRTAAVTVAVAAIGTSWWFALYASYQHAVYRLDFPDWTLVPGTIAIVLFVVLGLAARPIGAWLHRRELDAAAARLVPERLRPHQRQIIGWTLIVGWFLVLVVFFGRTPKLLGASLFDLDQMRFFVSHSIGSVRLVFAYTLGSVILVVELIRNRQRVAQASVDLLVALICGIPLVLLVAGVGETARHYIAVIALAILVGTVGWYHGLLRLRERDVASTILVSLLVLAGLGIVALSTLSRIGIRTFVVGLIALVVVAAIAAVTLTLLRRRNRLTAAGAALAVLVFISALGGAGVRAIRLNGEMDANEARAAADTVAWVKANVPAGQTVGLGPYLSMETLIGLPEGVPSVQIRHFLAIADASAPLGLRSEGRTGDDIVAIDDAPGKANQFDVYAADKITQLIRTRGVHYWVYPVSESRSSKSILGLLTPEHGFTEVATRTYPGTSDTINVHVYAIDPSKLPVSTDQIYISVDALGRLVEHLERDPGHGKVAAANLAARIVPPADGSEDALIERLKALAER